MSSNQPRKLFGTDGIRGEAGKFPLDAATVRVIGESLARRIAERTGRAPAIIIGRDTRESGPWIERALTAGAGKAGAEVRSAGVITTPGVAFLTRTIPADAGVVISASHNAYQDNGIKVFERSGRKLDDATERLIEADIAAASADQASTQKSEDEEVGEVGDETLGALYRDFLIHEVAQDLSLAGLTLVVDCANGASYDLAPKIFAGLGARVIPINDKPDGRNINLNCGSLHIDNLQARVVEERGDLGVAFDGDADRALFVDAKGRFVDGDATLWVMAKYLQSRNQLSDDLVVATVMSNIGLEIALRSKAINLTRTDVGDKYVLEELLRSAASLGGEQSGHIIFPKLSLAGDGLTTALRLLRVMREEKQSLSDLTAGFVSYPQVLINVRVREKPPFSEVGPIIRLARETEEKLGSDGRLLLRYSGTEPLARVMIEGKNQEEIEAYANALAEAIRLELGL